MTYVDTWPPSQDTEVLAQIITYPLSSSSLLRVEHLPDTAADGHPGPMAAFFVDGGSEIHGLVFQKDIQALAEAKSAGTHYWQVFRKKYKDPVVIEGPAKPKKERKPRAPKAAPAPADPMPPCPACGGTDVQHSGDLSEYKGEAIDPPAELLRCNARACWTRFRRDGFPYDEKVGASTYGEMPLQRPAVLDVERPTIVDLEISSDPGPSALAILDRMALQVNRIAGRALDAVNVDDLVARAVAVTGIKSHREAKAADQIAREIGDGIDNVKAIFDPFTTAANALHKALTGARGSLTNRLSNARAGLDVHFIDWSDHVESERLRIQHEQAEAEAIQAQAEIERMRGDREREADRMHADGDAAAASQLRSTPLPPVPQPQAPPRSSVVDLGGSTKVKREWIVDEQSPVDVDKLVAFVYANPTFRRTLIAVNLAGAEDLARAMGQDDGTTDFPLESGITPRFAPKVKRR